VAKRHLEFSLRWKGDKLGVLEMRRHYTNYFRGFRDVKQYRSRLVQEPNPEVIYEILEEVRDRYSEPSLAV